MASVLRAALAELASVGYVALRLDDVATRAGVAKTTIYRRWATKPELVRAAMLHVARYDDPLPDTGSLRSDLLAMLESSMKLVATPEGRAIARLVTMEGGDPEVDEMCRAVKDASRKRRAAVVVRAQERGELDAGADPLLITDCIFALVMSRLIRYREEVDRATCERLIDLVVTGAEHGGGQRRRPSRRVR